MQVGFRKYGQSGVEVTDWFQNVGTVMDDLALIRSVWTTDNDHGAMLQFHTGRHTSTAIADDRLLGALRPGLAQ